MEKSRSSIAAEQRESFSVPKFLVSRRFVLLWAVAFAIFFLGFSTKGTFDPAAVGRYLPGQFFSAQADAILHGRLWVLSSDLPSECFFSDNHCYGYFGVPPSLLRLPLVAVLGVQGADLTPLFLSIAAGIAMWAALDLCRRVLQREGGPIDGFSAWFMAVAAVVLGPGGLLMLVSDPYVYQEAIMWSVAGMLVGTNLFWRWWTDGKDAQFFGATAALVFAAGSRPTAALVGAVLAVGVVIARFVWNRIGWRTLLAAFLLATLPVVAIVGVWILKFGSVMPPNDQYQGRSFQFVQYNIANNGGELGNAPRFIPTAALTYLRPDTLRISTDWPFVAFRFGRPYGPKPLERITYLPPANVDSINVEPIVSLTNVAPLPLIATALAAIALLLRRRNQVGLILLVALATPFLITGSAQTIASRYLGDLYPLLAVGTAFSAILLPRLRRASGLTTSLVTITISMLTVLSVPIVLALAAQYNWAYRFGIK